MAGFIKTFFETMCARSVWLPAAIVLVADQQSKYFARTQLSFEQPVEVIPGFFNLTLVYNPGAAFGMFKSLPDEIRRLVLGVVSLIALLVVFRFLLLEAKEDLVSRVALAAILGGAAGNIIDRFRFDAVVDFLDFYYAGYHWPAFNVADSAICVGVAALVFRMFFPGCGDEKEELPAEPVSK